MAGAAGLASKPSQRLDTGQSPRPQGGGRQASGDQRQSSASGFGVGSAQSASQKQGTQKFLSR